MSAQDIKLAKQELSGRLLKAGLRRGPEAHLMAMTVSQAVAGAGTNVHGVGIGLKIVKGKATRQKCIRIHVTQKLAESIIPPRDALPKEVDGIPTDVIESPPAMLQATTKKATRKKSTRKKSTRKKSIRAKKSPKQVSPSCTQNKQTRQRPFLGGISAAQFEVTAGTIACICRSRKHGDDPGMTYVLSNNHVFANVNKAQIGDGIYQPGPLDGGVVDDTIANLHRYVMIKLGDNEANLVDAAIGKLLPDAKFDNAICMIGRITGTAVADVDMIVRKHGRTTGYTEGKITDVDFDAIVGMDHYDPSVRAVFNSQLRIEVIPPFTAFGLGGDSGSLVVQKTTQKAVGLYFAGPQSGGYGIANQIGDVLTELEIDLV